MRHSPWLSAATAPAAAAVLMMLSPAAQAQPTEVDIQAALADAAAAYRAAPTAERLIVAVRRAPGGLHAELAAAADATSAIAGAASLPAVRDRSERRADVILRLHPPAPAAPSAPGDNTDAKLSLELGDLRAVASDGALTAINTRHPETYFRAEYEAPLTPDDLARALPPLPIPQLDLALSNVAPPAALTPYATRILWNSAVVDDLTRPTRVLITGRSALGTVLLVTDPATGRIIEFACDMAAPDEQGVQPVLIVRVQPLPPPAVEDFAISIDGREPVAALTDLAPRRADLQAGQLVTGVSLTTLDGRPWTLADGFASPLGEPMPERLALLLVRASEADGHAALLQSAAAELQRLAALAQRERTWGVRWWGVIITDAAIADPQPPAAPRQWGVPAASTLWSSSAGAMLDRYAPGAAAAVIVIGQDRRLVGVVPLTPATEPAAIAPEIERLVWPRAAAPAQENGPAEEAGPE